MPLLTLLTDFGLADYYVGALKGTVLALAPDARIVDLSHQVPAGDVEAAAFLLAAAAPSFPAGTVHLAVVDPGVGSERRILAVETADACFLAPDNGLLTPILAPHPSGYLSGRTSGRAAGPADAPAVRAVERPDLYLPGPGRTFDGRDRFAPVAAALLRGEPAAALGPRIDDPVRLAAEPPRREGGTLDGRVVHVDRFGNLVTDLPSAWLLGEPPAVAAPRFRAEVADRAVRRLATHYRDLPPGEPGIVPGSLGTLEISLDGESLARRWGVERGARVRITLLA